MQINGIPPLGTKERHDIKKTLRGVVVGIWFFLPWVYMIIGRIANGQSVQTSDVPLLMGFLFFAFLLFQEVALLPVYYRRLRSVWLQRATAHSPHILKVMYSVFTVNDKKKAKTSLILTSIVFLLSIFFFFVSERATIIFSHLAICCMMNIFHDLCILQYANSG